MNLFETAQYYHDRGFSIIPQRLFTKENGKVAKIPPRGLNWKKFQTDRISKTHLLTKWRTYFKDSPGHGVAIITGSASGIMVVDIDDEEAKEIVKAHLPEDFKTVTVSTGSGGWHLYFKYREGLKTTAGLGDTGLDIRTDGGYIVAPPSRFPTDHPGQYIFQRDILDTEIQDMPEQLFFHIKQLIDRYYTPPANSSAQPRGAARSSWFLNAIEGVEEGQRILAMIRIMGQLRRQKVPKSIAWAIIQGWNIQNQPPEDENELQLQFESSWKNIVRNEDFTVLKAMNEEYAVVTTGNKVRILYNDKWGKLHMFPKNEFRDKLANQSIIQNGKERPIADLWLKWEDRKSYERVVFSPGDEDPESFNLWRGFSLVPSKGNWNKFRKHIENIIAPGFGDWVLKWMARIIQDPGGERPGTSIVLRGRQGTGKGIFANNFGKILGVHYKIINNLEYLTGRFNEDLATTLLLHIDEATWGGDKTTAGQLKNLITEPQRRMEIKAGDIMYVDNHLNLIISSNNKWVVPSGPMERRFFVLDVGEEHLQDQAYFNAIMKQLRTGGYEAMMYDLQAMEYDLDELRHIPHTAGTRDQVIRGLDFTQRFWYSRLVEGKLVEAHRLWKHRVVTDKLYAQYMDYCQQRGFSRSIEDKSLFIRELKKLCPQLKKIRANNNGSRFNCLVVPPIDTARALFDQFISGDVDLKWEPVAEPEDSGQLELERNTDLPGHFRSENEYYN